MATRSTSDLVGTLLIKNTRVLVTMDKTRREIEAGSLYAEDGVITAIGSNLPITADVVVDAKSGMVTPGLINTHHHLFQTLTRAVPGAQDALLFGWLRKLYPIWAKFTPDAFRCATQIGLAELALSGTTLSADHQYLFPNGSSLDNSIEAARDIGLRFHPTRGSMSIGESAGGLPPDSLIEDETAILNDSERLIDRYHDPKAGAMLQIGLAPCSPFSVTQNLMRETATLARDKGVRLHTHLAENAEDVAYSLERFGCRPGEYAQDLGWVGDDVWHAHCVELDKSEIDLFARTKTGIAHCPCSNCRLGSGIAPLTSLIERDVPTGLGVDGSASNDAAHLLSEARQALLLQRVARGADAMTARQALELATIGGARVLGRDDLGSLEIGKRADFAIWNMDSLAAAGAWDPVAALVLTGPHQVDALFVEGKSIVQDGRLTTLDLEKTLSTAHKLVKQLMN